MSEEGFMSNVETETSNGIKSGEHQTKTINNSDKQYICRKAFPYKKESEHMKTHPDEHKCHICEKAFKQKIFLLKHINSLHTKEQNKGKVSCPVCGKMLAIGYIDRHIEAHSSVPEKHGCPQCGKICSTSKILRAHIKRIHETDGEYSFKCDTCGNNYKNMASLREHITKIHSDTKRPVFGCKFCDKKFLYKPNLVEHERHHTGEKPFFCQHCDESFRIKAQLKRHEQIHIGAKPYKCATCSKTFGFLQNLKNHVLIHSEDFPFACPNAPSCPKRFNTKSNSQRHFVNCRAEKPSVSKNDEEDDSERNHSELPVKRNFGIRRRIIQPGQQFDQSKIIWKECAVSIKRTHFIERAIWLGYSSLTRVSRLDKKKGRQVGQWVNSAQIGAGPGPKRRKVLHLAD